MEDDRVDIEALLEEIRREAQRLRSEGRMTLALERELDGHLRPDIPPPQRKREIGRMRAALADAGYRTAITPDVPAASERRGGRAVKRGVKALVGWYVGTVANQMREFAGANLRALAAVSDAVREVDNDLTRLEWRLEALEDRLATPSPHTPDDPDAT